MGALLNDTDQESKRGKKIGLGISLSASSFVVEAADAADLNKQVEEDIKQ